MGTSPEQGLEKIHARFGAHDGHRALHAKGIHCAGTFTATPEGSRLTRAPHMSGTPIPTKVRFSNGGGDPNVPDYVPDVRGLATAFESGDGVRFDLLAQTISRFPFRDQEGFFAVLAASKPAPSSLLKLPGLIVRYPRAVKGLAETNRVMADRRSFAARPYFTFHAYRYLDAEGRSRWVRHQWRPTAAEPGPSKDEAKAAGRDYLFDELRDRLTREPVRMELEVQIAEDGDDPHDPSAEWPAERERLIAGTLEVTGVDDAADDSIVYDPARTVDGIELSNDPVLHYRPAVYTHSHARRTGA